MPNNGVYRNILPVYGTLNEKVSYAFESILKAQQNQEEDTDTVTVYLFLAKIRCRSFCFSNCQKKVYRVFFIPCIFRQFTVHSPIYGTLNENKLLSRAQQNQEGDTNTVYCHGIPLSGKTYDVDFHVVLVLEDVCFF